MCTAPPRINKKEGGGKRGLRLSDDDGTTKAARGDKCEKLVQADENVEEVLSFFFNSEFGMLSQQEGNYLVGGEREQRLIAAVKLTSFG